MSCDGLKEITDMPKLVQDNLGAIHPNPKTAVALAVKAADAFKLEYEVPPEKLLKLAIKLGEAEIARKGHQAIWHGHLRDDSGNLSGDAYSFEGSDYAVIGHGDDMGFFKNEKNMTRKMTREEFEKLPDEFRNSLRLQPHWK